jgi:hypothetical protein
MSINPNDDVCLVVKKGNRLANVVTGILFFVGSQKRGKLNVLPPYEIAQKNTGC